MEDESINSLREALNFSPDNIPLRLHLADAFLKSGRLDEASTEFKEVLKTSNSRTAKKGLATVAFQLGDFSLCNVILEELLTPNTTDISILVLHAKALAKEGNLGEAVDVYKRVKVLDENYSDDDLDASLTVRNAEEIAFSEDEELDSSFLERPDINFADVGGMHDLKKQIDLKIIQPLNNPEIYKAYGKKIGGGILLYGPPGCGKTYLAKATAGQIKAKFINVSLNDVLDMYIGNSEKNLHELFELARANTPCVLFFDEIDALGASRSDMKQSSGRHLINQFLQELDGVESNNDGVLVLGATNTPWHLDTAFRRPGRFDRILFVPPPDVESREDIYRIALKGKPQDAINVSKLAKVSKDFSGADIMAVIDIAIEGKLEEAISEGVPKPLITKDLLEATKKHKSSIKEWFSTAKNFALYANESGQYDEILSYLKLMK
ncbi:MAG: cell division protein [Bacteroidetes bacterium]|nr:MAG: cell division protein [Bacteroidota bacterium]